MTYQQVIDLFRATANDASVNATGFFLNASGKNPIERQAALSACYNEKFPQIGIFYLKQIGSVSKHSQDYKMLVTFLNQDDPSSAAAPDDDKSLGTLKTTEEIVDDMQILAKAFIDKLDQTSKITITGYEGAPEIKTLSSTLSGWGLSISISTIETC